MATTEKSRLAFGYNRGLPETTDAAWGARLIYPNDLLPDRTDMIGSREAKDRLLAALNSPAVPEPAAYPSLLAEAGIESSGVDLEAILYEDDTLCIKANPQASHGYLYVVAYLKEGA